MKKPTKNTIREYMAFIGKKGGKKTAKRGKEYYSKIAQQRWKKVKNMEKVDN